MTKFLEVIDIKLPDLGGLVEYLYEECVVATYENVRGLLQRLNDPKSFINIELSGAIVDEIKKNGVETLISSKFINKYGDDLALAALSGISQATGYDLESVVKDTLNTVYKYINIMYMMNNQVLFIMLKIVATNIVMQLERKLAREEEVKVYLTALHNVISELSKVDPIFNRYLENLKQAYYMVVKAKKDIRLAKNSMGVSQYGVDQASNVPTYLQKKPVYLTRAVEEAKTLVADARMMVRPSTGGNPYITPLYNPNANKPPRSTSTVTGPGSKKQISTNLPNQEDTAGVNPAKAASVLSGRLIGAAGLPTRIPTASELAELEEKARKLKNSPSSIKPEEMDAVDNMALIPLLSYYTINAMKDYATLTATTNGMIITFLAGTTQIRTAMYQQMQSTAFDLLEQIEFLLGNLEGSMKEAIFPIQKGKKNSYQNPVMLTAMSFKWVVDMTSIISLMKLLPDKALTDINHQLSQIYIYTDTVKRLEAMDTIKSGLAVLEANNAQEVILNYENQMLTALLQVNAFISDWTTGSRILPLLRTLVERNNLSIKRDTEIIRVMQAYIDFQFDGEKEFNRMLTSINGMMERAGMDRAINLWKSGDYKAFFGMDPKTASYVGAGLEAIAFLKECFKGSLQRKKFDLLQLKLEREKDLLGLKISFDFDKLFRMNLKKCKVNEQLSASINLDSILCDLATKAFGSIFDPLEKQVKVPDFAMDDSEEQAAQEAAGIA